jgi:hypothetical protein
VKNSTTISRQGLGPIFGVEGIWLRSDISTTNNSERTKKEKNATYWTCPNQVITFHLTTVNSKGLSWVLMVEGKKKEI